MISTTGLVAAFAVLALAVSIVDNEDASPHVGAEQTFIVAPSGGDFDTLQGAVDEAVDGDTILVRPGLYTGTLRVDEDITIQGDGPKSEIIVEAAQDPESRAICEPDQPFHEEIGCAFVLVDSDATIAGLTLRGDYAGVMVYGGAPTLSDLRFERIGEPWGRYEDDALAPSEATHLEGFGGSLTLRGGTRARVVGSEFISTGPLMIEQGSAPDIDGNVLRDGSFIIAGGAGDGTRISDNTITDSYGFAAILATFDAHDDVIDDDATITIEGNTIARQLDDGIRLPATGRVRVIGNEISGSKAGIRTEGVSTIEVNVLSDNAVGVALIRSDAALAGNTIRGNDAGVQVSFAAPTLDGNTISDGRVGLLVIGAESAPALTGNRICENDAEVELQRDAVAPDLTANEACDAVG